jgi:hypothetical protein
MAGPPEAPRDGAAVDAAVAVEGPAVGVAVAVAIPRPRLSRLPALRAQMGVVAPAVVEEAPDEAVVGEEVATAVGAGAPRSRSSSRRPLASSR